MMPSSMARCWWIVTLPTLRPTLGEHAPRLAHRGPDHVRARARNHRRRRRRCRRPTARSPRGRRRGAADGRVATLGKAGAVDRVVAVAASCRRHLVRLGRIVDRHDHRTSRSPTQECGRCQLRLRRHGRRPRPCVCWPVATSTQSASTGRELGFADASDGERLVGRQELVGFAVRPDRQDAAATPVALIDRDDRPGVAGLDALEDLADIGAGERLAGRGRQVPGPATPALKSSSTVGERFEARRRGRLESASGSAARNRTVASSNARDRVGKRSAVDAVELGRDVASGQTVVRAVSRRRRRGSARRSPGR